MKLKLLTLFVVLGLIFSACGGGSAATQAPAATEAPAGNPAATQNQPQRGRRRNCHANPS